MTALHLRLAVRILRFADLILRHRHVHLQADERTGGGRGVSAHARRCYTDLGRRGAGEGAGHLRRQRCGLRAEGHGFLASVFLSRSSATAISLDCPS